MFKGFVGELLRLGWETQVFCQHPASALDFGPLLKGQTECDPFESFQEIGNPVLLGRPLVGTQEWVTLRGFHNPQATAQGFDWIFNHCVATT